GGSSVCEAAARPILCSIACRLTRRRPTVVIDKYYRLSRKSCRRSLRSGRVETGGRGGEGAMPYGYTISETQFAGAVDKDGPLYTGRFHAIDINRDGVTDLFGTLQFQDQHGPAPYVAFLGDGDGGF